MNTWTFDNLLLDSKCTFSTFETDEDQNWVGVVDVTSTSTPPTFSTKQGCFSFSTIENINLNQKTKNIKPTLSTK